MRSPGLVWAGLSAAVLLLTACGGSDEEPDAGSAASSSSTSSSSSGAAAPSGSPAPTGASTGSGGADDVATFCDQALALQTALTEQLTTAADTDPATVPGVLQSSADQYEQIDAPAEIEQDWQVLSDSAQQLADLSQDVDFTQPGALDEFAASLADEEEAATAANANVQDYVQTNCAAG